MNRALAVRAWLVCFLLLGSACGDGGARSSTTTYTTLSTVNAEVTMSAFVAAADAACLAVFAKVAALKDPDGVGGQKQLGLGTVVREFAEALAAIAAPSNIAIAWAEATDLLRQSGVKLEEAEALTEATGDPNAGGPAQSEALWDLQGRASEIILGLDIPFLACSFD